MSIIKRISVQSYTYTLDDFGPSISTYTQGVSIEIPKFVVTIETNDGLRGSYAPHFGATQHALAQVNQVAPSLIGQDAEKRELIFERLKSVLRHIVSVFLCMPAQPLDRKPPEDWTV